MKYRLAKIVIKFVKAIIITDTPIPRPATLHSLKTTFISNNTTSPPRNLKKRNNVSYQIYRPKENSDFFSARMLFVTYSIHTKDITDKLHSVLHKKKDGGKSIG